MLWQFGELGYDFPINYCPDGSIQESCRVDPKPIRWDYLDNADRRDLYGVIRDLIYLKTQFEVFNTTDYTLSLVRDDWKKIFLRHEEMNVAVLGNFNVEPEQISNPFPSPGWWYEYFSGDSLLVQRTTDPLSLTPGEYRVYTTRRIEKPGDMTTSRPELVRHQFHLSVYPNPSPDRPTVTYSLDQSAPVTLEVYNILGQRIFHANQGRRSAGDHELNLQVTFPPGTYLIKLLVGNQIESTWVLVQ
jgi:hypothetical protein